MAGNAVELTDATFDEIVHNSEAPVLVDFWAPWCGPCKMMAPVIEELAGEYAEKAKICKLNTDEARDSAVEFVGVCSIDGSQASAEDCGHSLGDYPEGVGL